MSYMKMSADDVRCVGLTVDEPVLPAREVRRLLVLDRRHQLIEGLLRHPHAQHSLPPPHR
eukprot:6358126-Prymnesium_polylepis.1